MPTTHIKMPGCGGQSREGLNRRSPGAAWIASLAKLMVSRPRRNALSIEMTAFIPKNNRGSHPASTHTYLYTYTDILTFV